MNKRSKLLPTRLPTKLPTRLVKSLATALVILASLALPAIAQDAMTGEQVMAKSLQANYYAGLDRMTEGKMTITDKNGSVRIRQFKVLRRNQTEQATAKDDQNYFVKFSHPNDLDGMVFMVKKHVGTTDDRWLYLPKLDLVRRIAAGDKRTSFVGSDVLYEDVSGRHLMEDTHELESQSKSYFVTKSTPKLASAVEFKYYKTWVHKETFLALKREYYDANDNKYRQIKVKKVANINGIPTIMDSQVHDYNTGSITSVSCGDVKYDVGIKNDLFTERFLRNPPDKLFDM
jgi:outer membrane lipoprotein-sorting protein